MYKKPILLTAKLLSIAGILGIISACSTTGDYYSQGNSERQVVLSAKCIRYDTINRTKWPEPCPMLYLISTPVSRVTTPLENTNRYD